MNSPKYIVTTSTKQLITYFFIVVRLLERRILYVFCFLAGRQQGYGDQGAEYLFHANKVYEELAVQQDTIGRGNKGSINIGRINVICVLLTVILFYAKSVGGASLDPR